MATPKKAGNFLARGVAGSFARLPAQRILRLWSLLHIVDRDGGHAYSYFLRNEAHRIAGWSSLVARRAHNPKVVGSNPAPATITCLVGAREGPDFFVAGPTLVLFWSCGLSPDTNPLDRQSSPTPSNPLQPLLKDGVSEVRCRCFPAVSFTLMSAREECEVPPRTPELNWESDLGISRQI